MTDAFFYRVIIAHLRQGLPYHRAFADALRCDLAPTIPVFTFRPPLLYELLRYYPGTAPAWMLFTEVWAGLFLMLALAARWPWVRLALVSVAVLLRELAVPAFVVLALWHWRDRRARTVGMLACLLFAAYYGWHWHAAIAQQRPGDLHSPGWLAFGGAAFWLTMARVTPVGLFWPHVGPWLWLAAVWIALLLPWVDPPLRLIMVGYLFAFAIAGRPDNEYWSWVIWPAQALAMLQAVTAGRLERCAATSETAGRSA